MENNNNLDKEIVIELSQTCYHYTIGTDLTIHSLLREDGVEVIDGGINSTVSFRHRS
jgi:hypothetical protein